MHAPHIWPIPDHFWQRQSIVALDPTIWYVGPMVSGDRATSSIAPRRNDIALVYIIGGEGRCLYVGKTINLVGRFSQHRHTKDWWHDADRLVVLGIPGEDRCDAESAALHIELLAIRDCRPIRNIAGVKV